MNKSNGVALISLGGFLTLLIGLLTTALCTWGLREANDTQTRAAVQFEALKAADAVSDRLRLYEYGLRGARGVVLTAGEHLITYDAFHRYSRTRNLSAEFPGARGFGFIRRVPMAQEKAFQAAVRADGQPNFLIRQLIPQPDDRFVVQYIEPLDQNRRALGLDIASDPSRREAALEAIRTGNAQLTAPITLVQANDKQHQGFLMLMPIYRDTLIPSSIAEREQSAFGWSYAPLVIADVLASFPGQNDSVHLRLIDITVPGQEIMFYDSGTDSPGTQNFVAYKSQLNLYGRHWRLEITPHPAFIQGLHLVSPNLILFLGVFITLLFTVLVGLGSVSRQRRSLVAAQQTWLAAIVESSSDGIIGKTLDGIVTSWNKGAEQLFGYTSLEAVGQPLAKLIMPDGYEREKIDILEKIRRGEHISGFQTKRLRQNKSLIDVSLTVSPIRDETGLIIGASKTVRDITAEKNTEAKILELNSSLEEQVIQRTSQLSELNMLLASVLDSASQVSIIATDLDGVIKVFNKGSERLLGYKAEEMVNKHTPSIIHVPEEVAARSLELSAEYGQSIDGFRALVYKAKIEGIAQTDEWSYVRKDGSRFPVILVITAMRDVNGQLSGYLGIAIDITVRRELESSLRLAKEQADTASAAKSSFLANMSHEIRTPMNAVLGMLQLVLHTEMNVRQYEYVTKAQTAAKSLLRLLNDILDYSKIEANKLQLDLHPFELETLLCDLAVVLAGNQKVEAVEVMFDLDVGLPKALIGDSFRLQQILINLAGNALKFTSSGQVVISVKKLSDSLEGICLRIAITDTGIGISPEQLERIFDGFTQAEASTSRRFGGTGLGLVICQNMIKLMGGVLRVDSQPGIGSRFWFDVALDIAKGTELLAEEVVGIPTMRILIVDDNAIACEILMHTVTALGWQADCVMDGALAVERVREAREQGQGYGVVLMDWRMPGMDGLSVAEVIRRQGSNQPLPIVIMITAYGREALNDIYQEGNAPFVGMLTKPVTPRQLIIAITDAVNGARMPHPGAYFPVFKSSTRLAGLQLLVIEDNMINRQIAESLFSNEGATVKLAESGIAGVNRVIANSEVFDAVLMDMQMPDIDGLEATRRIRADPRFANLPIVAMTANASRADRELCLAAGMNEHVGKPIDLEQLIATLLSQTGKLPVGAIMEAKLEHDCILESRASVARRMGGNLELIRNGLKDFGYDMHQQLAKLQCLVESQDTTGARSVLHAIKGSAGTMGAMALSLRAGQLESQLQPDVQALSDVLTVSGLEQLHELMILSLTQMNVQYAG
ncbi:MULTISPECIES: CHASE domain-containing protein [unclassified Pseudomonas]|uniref:CHASE domain-containing protein n=1 Tax=unclassified Pseudomonas TaxID=196821 RepID=UPI002B2310E2|nr:MULTISPECIES: CHASE domain-containing protein [unclassified Pseudomonas]MEA9978027.1 CHASE domain-containing protein [Pseudomonas sp. RTS4]MEB0198532.1 CHASE domain-containing protein [Pseudomonas sp. 5S4]MEB0245969.1 CHASE domain-containing protein [Pseudomonas sp. 10S5]